MAEPPRRRVEIPFPLEGGNPAYAPINYVPVKYNSATLAGRSAWSTPSAGHVTPNTFGLGARNVTLGAGQSTTLTFTGTSCKIAYRRPSFLVEFTYAVDGGTAVPVSIPAGTEADRQVVEIGPLTTGVHTVTVTGVTNQLSLEGAYIYNGEKTRGIQFFGSAKHGVRSDHAFGSTLNLFKPCVTRVDPHCIYVGLGTSDHDSNIAPATYNTNMRTLITAMQQACTQACTLPPTIVLAIDSGRTTGFTYPWSDYVAALRGIAADNPTTISVLDLSVRLPALGDNALGLYADSLHESNKGQAFRADVLAGFLSPS